jgi:hypothetical protein
MNWANHAIEKLRAGQDAVVIPHGGSMRPKVLSGARVTLTPLSATEAIVGDIVLCRVKGNVYLHLVKAVQGDGRVLIGNNRGGVNGWTKAVYGKATEVENP